MTLIFWGFFILLPALYGLERLPLGIDGLSHYVSIFLYILAAVVAAVNFILRGIRCNLDVSINNKFLVFLLSLLLIALIAAHIFDNSNIEWSIMGIERLAFPLVFFFLTLSLPGRTLEKMVVTLWQ